uniref:Hyaluronidase n=1 Tax=Bursaphelenchus xylophilus TaxID=6326 RepID=A0A1I7SFW7_BURXY
MRLERGKACFDHIGEHLLECISGLKRRQYCYDCFFQNFQAANLSAHLEKAAKDLESAIPDPNFDGYGVIDYEAWRPLYDLNWSSRRIYQRYSRTLLERDHAKMNPHELEHLARETFDTAAREFMVETLKLAKKMRPKGKWGFWEYPLCDYSAGYNQSECLAYYDDYNAQLSYIPENADALYPSIYFYGDDPSEGRLKHAYARLKQTYNYAAKFNKNLRIIPYIKIEYSPSDSVDADFYSKNDLCASIKYPMELGVEAVIIWSSSYRMKQRCNGLEEYLKNQLGPFATEVKRKAKK